MDARTRARMLHKFGRKTPARRPVKVIAPKPVRQCTTRVTNCRKVQKIRCDAAPEKWVSEIRKEGSCIKEYTCTSKKNCTLLRGKSVCNNGKKRCRFVRTISCETTEIFQDRQEDNCVNRYKCNRKRICDKSKRCKFMVSGCRFFRKMKCDEKIVRQPPVKQPTVVEQPEEGPAPEDRPTPTVVEDPKPTPRPKPEEKPAPEPEPEPEPEPVKEKPRQTIPVMVPAPAPIPIPVSDNSDLFLATQLAQVRMQLTTLLPGLLQQLREKKSCCAQRSPCCNAPLVHHESGKPYRGMMRRLERKLRALKRRQERRGAERRRFSRQRRLSRRLGDNLEEEIYRN